MLFGLIKSNECHHVFLVDCALLLSLQVRMDSTGPNLSLFSTTYFWRCSKTLIIFGRFWTLKLFMLSSPVAERPLCLSWWFVECVCCHSVCFWIVWIDVCCCLFVDISIFFDANPQHLALKMLKNSKFDYWWLMLVLPSLIWRWYQIFTWDLKFGKN